MTTDRDTPEATPGCSWSEDTNGTWVTKCGHYFQVTDGTPSENEFAYCCYCGGNLIEHVYVEEDSND